MLPPQLISVICGFAVPLIDRVRNCRWTRLIAVRIPEHPPTPLGAATLTRSVLLALLLDLCSCVLLCASQQPIWGLFTPCRTLECPENCPLPSDCHRKADCDFCGLPRRAVLFAPHDNRFGRDFPFITVCSKVCSFDWDYVATFCIVATACHSSFSSRSATLTPSRARSDPSTFCTSSPLHYPSQRIYGCMRSRCLRPYPAIHEVVDAVTLWIVDPALVSDVQYVPAPLTHDGVPPRSLGAGNRRVLAFVWICVLAYGISISEGQDLPPSSLAPRELSYIILRAVPVLT
ncbi:hypothetical protein MVEN_01640600 [Mycena venus]|uniref:Uncharacterized protein n=1 Tax=Mycena venus TaxID=2733690 RepID=A0A8H6XR32_9AGAR|nr:hypothetical protein MVEN_01640600 [Mycena venus]